MRAACADESYGAALGLIPIDCAAAAYQLVDLNIATRRAGFRLRALSLRLPCDPRVFPDAARLVARLVRSFFRIDNLPALNRLVGDRRTLLSAPSRDRTKAPSGTVESVGTVGIRTLQSSSAKEPRPEPNGKLKQPRHMTCIPTSD
jgi:hypothetical protein